VAKDRADEDKVQRSTSRFAAAVARQQWALVSLRLVFGVTRAASTLPSDSFKSLLPGEPEDKRG
jgi:hypothetical protein